ncbi:MAG TPA: DUF5666 domain-containing protein [Terriglobia bacterium]|nr:DUF5666 domain-containing protein [Terriglobia bacterium]
MNRILSIAIVVLVAASAFAADRLNPDPEQISIATTGRIVRIDMKTRTLKVRGGEGLPVKAPDIKESLWQRIGMKMPSVHMPVSLRISLPGRTANLSEFTVVTTDDTVFQDGADPLRLEDFKSGETISIHGLLSGGTLQASRIAKWD